MEKALLSLGLTETESKVYIALLKKGTSLAGKITKEIGIHRRTVYDAIERLVEKGLVSYITEDNKKYFEAVNPERLFDILREKEGLLLNVINEMNSFYKSTKDKRETLFFRGKQALKSVFDDQIKNGKEILMLSKGIDVNEIIKFYFPRFDAARVEKKIHIKILFDEGAKKLSYIKKIPLAKIKYLKDGNSSLMSTYIYGDNVSLVVWTNEPIAILIRQKEFADGFRNYFNLLWNIRKD